jgi:uncharacterized protein (TIGR00255 family)
MTGYGKSSVSSERSDIEIEVKSVNHRFLDLNFRMPQIFNDLEMKLREKAKKMISRGSVTVYINVNSKFTSEKIKSFDFEAAKAYKDTLEKLRRELSIDQEINMDMILKFQDIFIQPDEKESGDTPDKIIEGFEKAVLDMLSYREKEGQNIYNDLSDHINNLEKLVDEIAGMAGDCSNIQFEKLMARLKNFELQESFSKERLEQELVMISDRVDISEEISRLRSHISLFRETLEQNKPVGKTINNLTQEMHREASTISAKTNLTDISHISVGMKEIIEMIREQAQNVE